MSLLTNNDYYTKLDGNSNDATGNGNNGTDTSITYSAANGIINQGAGFDGGTSNITLPSSSLFKPIGAFTINAWLKTSSATNQVIFQSWSNVGGTYSGWQFYYFTAGTAMIFQTAKDTGNVQGTDWQFVEGTMPITNGTFHMVTGIYDGGSLYIYVNGTLDKSIAWANNPAYAATTYQRIGCGNDSGTNNSFTNGAIDEVGLWSRALSSTEITQLYNGGAGLQYPYGISAGGLPRGSLSMLGIGN